MRVNAAAPCGDWAALVRDTTAPWDKVYCTGCCAIAGPPWDTIDMGPHAEPFIEYTGEHADENHEKGDGEHGVGEESPG